MKIAIELKNNGIHEYMDCNIENPKSEYIKEIRQILETIEKFNDEASENA